MGWIPPPFYTRVQFCGATLPTKTSWFPYMFDPCGQVGICGDCILGSSMEDVALSGMPLGNHMENYFQCGRDQPDEFSVGLHDSFGAVSGHDIHHFPDLDFIESSFEDSKLSDRPSISEKGICSLYHSYIKCVSSILLSLKYLLIVVFSFAKKIATPYDLIMHTKQLGRLPIVQFVVDGVETPDDATLMMQLGYDGVFVGSGIFKSSDPACRAIIIMQDFTHYFDSEIMVDVSAGLGKSMVGINLSNTNGERFAAHFE
ncbi:Pyridoxal biosynthesis protein PDX1 [Platanthera guangdongensis]|uniref:pyridoxal 5'-phosphate synthase (glutamine hydrolyzing) n=1 Tax=Platanthera guangdongensis TaxID=2320717 RepID=A0ABR2MRE0_9ASPA